MKKLSEDKLKEIKGGNIIGVSPFVSFNYMRGTRKGKNLWRKIFGR